MDYVKLGIVLNRSVFGIWSVFILSWQLLVGLIRDALNDIEDDRSRFFICRLWSCARALLGLWFLIIGACIGWVRVDNLKIESDFGNGNQVLNFGFGLFRVWVGVGRFLVLCKL